MAGRQETVEVLRLAADLIASGTTHWGEVVLEACHRLGVEVTYVMRQLPNRTGDTEEEKLATLLDMISRLERE